MEATIVYIIYWGYRGIMEKKMEATIVCVYTYNIWVIYR